MRNQLGRALLLAGRAEEALAELRPLVARLPDYGPAYHSLVVAAVETGHVDEARAAVREVRRIGPHWTMCTIDSLWFFRRPADAERFRAAYRAAGLPEDRFRSAVSCFAWAVRPSHLAPAMLRSLMLP